MPLQVLVHEMETLSKMFNAMEQRYVSHALDDYNKDFNSNSEDGTNLVEDVLKADEADSKVNIEFKQLKFSKSIKEKILFLKTINSWRGIDYSS